jgi:hypothetical protein
MFLVQYPLRHLLVGAFIISTYTGKSFCSKVSRVVMIINVLSFIVSGLAKYVNLFCGMYIVTTN